MVAGKGPLIVANDTAQGEFMGINAQCTERGIKESVQVNNRRQKTPVAVVDNQGNPVDKAIAPLDKRYRPIQSRFSTGDDLLDNGPLILDVTVIYA